MTFVTYLIITLVFRNAHISRHNSDITAIRFSTWEDTTQ